MTKLTIFKYISAAVIVLLSGYSYVFLNNQSELLTSSLKIRKSKERKVILRDSKNKPTKIVIIAPPSEKMMDKDKAKKKDYKEEKPQKEETGLPDVEFLKFMIQKGKEGIPVLEFRDFFKY